MRGFKNLSVLVRGDKKFAQSKSVPLNLKRGKNHQIQKRDSSFESKICPLESQKGKSNWEKYYQKQ